MKLGTTKGKFGQLKKKELGTPNMKIGTIKGTFGQLETQEKEKGP